MKTRHPSTLLSVLILVLPHSWVLAQSNTNDLSALALSLGIPQTGLSAGTIGSTGEELTNVLSWHAQTNVTHDEISAAEALFSDFNRLTWMETTVIGPGTLNFWWKFSGGRAAGGQAATMVRFVFGDEPSPGPPGCFENCPIWGEIENYGPFDWRMESVDIPVGPQKVRWEFRSFFSFESLASHAAWVDQVQFVPGGSSPSITVQPQGRLTTAEGTIQAHGSAQFNVAVRGTPPFGFRWRFNGTELHNGNRNNIGIFPLPWPWDGTNLHSAFGSTVSISPVYMRDTGAYTVVITNAFGSVTSAPPAVLRLLAPLSDPHIELTHIPLVGSSEDLRGRTFGIPSTDYRLLVFLYNGSWFPKPTYANPWTIISSNMWSCDVTTGGSDTAAPAYLIYALPSIYEPPGYPPPPGGGFGLPSDIDSYAVAKVHVTRNAGSVAAPLVSFEPQSQSRLVGDTASFQVAVTGEGPISIQWDHDGQVLQAATNDTLIVANLRANDSGAYSATVTGSGGSVSTRVARLVVLLPPMLASPVSLSDGSFQFTFTNSPGAIFKVLATTNLALPMSKWTLVDSVTEISPGQFEFADPQAFNNSQRFFGVFANDGPMQP